MRKRSRNHRAGANFMQWAGNMECLEPRTLLATIPTNAVALFDGMLDSPTDIDNVQIQISPQTFSLPHSDNKQVTLGFILHPTGHSLLPKAVEITALTPKRGNVPTLL